MRVLVKSIASVRGRTGLRARMVVRGRGERRRVPGLALRLQLTLPTWWCAELLIARLIATPLSLSGALPNARWHQNRVS